MHKKRMKLWVRLGVICTAVVPGAVMILSSTVSCNNGQLSNEEGLPVGDTEGMGVLAAGSPAANLDQLRNGQAAAPSCPGQWENGNINASQAHMFESYSIPYRCVMTNLPVGAVISLVLGYDVKNNGKNAIDYLTHYQRLDPHTGFRHGAEVINPLLGLAGTFAVRSTYLIPPPRQNKTITCLPGNLSQPATSYNILKPLVPATGCALVPPFCENAAACDTLQRRMTLFGGTLIGIAYDTAGGFKGPDLNAAQDEERIVVSFTASQPTVVLAWGGHIAWSREWGCPGISQSAAGVSGSSYHMRLKSWSGSAALGKLGNQDRSLSGDAISFLGACCTSGVCGLKNQADCESGGGRYFGDGSQCTTGICGCIIQCPADPSVSFEQYSCQNPPPPAVTGSAVCTGDTCQSSFSDSCAPECGTITRTWSCTAGGVTVTCDQIITISGETTPPTFDDCASTNRDLGFNPANIPGCDTSVTASDNGGPAWVTCASSDSGPSCARVRTLTYVATDHCGNTATCVQTLTWVTDSNQPTFDHCAPGSIDLGCNPASIPGCDAGVTACDSCGAATVNCSVVDSVSDCGRGRTLTYTAADACGNTATCVQTFSWVADTAQPTITCAGPASVNCPAAPNFQVPTVPNSCDSSLTITFSDATTPGACAASYNVMRTWTAADSCGHHASCSQAITVTCPCGQACSPEYWKQSQHFHVWCERSPYVPASSPPSGISCICCTGTPTTLLNAFGIDCGQSPSVCGATTGACAALSTVQKNTVVNLTLLDAVSMTGGVFDQMLSQGSVALLNASAIGSSFDHTRADVDNVMRRAFCGAISFRSAANTFSSWNAAESTDDCPLPP